MIKKVSSDYIDDLRRQYSLYIIESRALISEADGLKTSARRLLWMAKSSGKAKVAALAGDTMKLHPHGAPEGPAQNIAGTFINNIPLLEGQGAFGTLAEPNAFGAARYISVKPSRFTKDALLIDLDIIPMVDNYDQTMKEPRHYLPLVPLSLVNPSEGIVVGFRSCVLPRTLGDVIKSQIAHLQGKKFKEPHPHLEPINSRAWGKDGAKWLFYGGFQQTAHNKLIIDNLPFGVSLTNIVDEVLPKLVEQERIVDFEDRTSDKIEIEVTFKKGALKNYDEDELLYMLGLESKQSEAMTMVAFDGVRVVNHTYESCVKAFCDWRLDWFTVRYQHQKDLDEANLQFVRDMITTIKSGVADKFAKAKDKEHLYTLLRNEGVVLDEQVARQSAYAFNKAELAKYEAKAKELKASIQKCNKLITSESARKEQFIAELEVILENYKKGHYVAIP